MNHLLRILSGFWYVRFYSEEPERVLNELRKKGCRLSGISRIRTGIEFFLSRRDLSILNDFCKDLREGERIESTRKGIPARMMLFRKRIGLFIGAALFFVLIQLAGKFVWSVDIEGNENYSDAQVRLLLEDFHICSGTAIKKLDKSRFSLLFPTIHPEFSYASLSFVGTRAKVTIREREKLPEGKKEEAAQNIVASHPARIVRYEVLEGQIAVERGEIVKEGDLLISGIQEHTTGIWELVSARGRVFGETERIFEVTVPLHEEIICYTGREQNKKTLNILGLQIPISPPVFGESDGMESIVTEEVLELWGKSLPIIIKEETFLEREQKSTFITVDRARKLAYDKYNEYKRDTFLSDAEILSEEVAFSEGEEGVTMTVFIRAVENIARSEPIRMTS